MRNRQDISEQMFLTISRGICESVTSKLMVNSTTCYFELPYYGSGAVAGSLLTDGPTNLCNSTKQCLNQNKERLD